MKNLVLYSIVYFKGKYPLIAEEIYPNNTEIISSSDSVLIVSKVIFKNSIVDILLSLKVSNKARYKAVLIKVSLHLSKYCFKFSVSI